MRPHYYYLSTHIYRSKVYWMMYTEKQLFKLMRIQINTNLFFIFISIHSICSFHSGVWGFGVVRVFGVEGLRKARRQACGACLPRSQGGLWIGAGKFGRRKRILVLETQTRHNRKKKDYTNGISRFKV